MTTEKLIKEINKLTEAQMYNILRNIAIGGDMARNLLSCCIIHEKSISIKDCLNLGHTDSEFKRTTEHYINAEKIF